MTDSKQILTTGEFKVRTNFNVTKSTLVDLIKEQGAVLINTLDALDNEVLNNNQITISEREMSEFRRLKALAMTSVEEGVMWGVKAATI